MYSSVRTTNSWVATQQAGAPIQFAQEAVPCPFSKTFSLFIGGLNIDLGAGEENDFDHRALRRTLAFTTSQGVPCDRSLW